MFVEIMEDRDSAVIHMNCNVINAANADMLFKQVQSSLSRKLNTIINLHSVGLMDSSGLGFLINCYKKIKENGGTMKLVASNPIVLTLLELVSFKTVSEVHTNLEDAFRR